MPAKNQTVYRLEKRETFTRIDNDAIRDSSLSWKATGLLCFMLSQVNGWRFSSAQLAAIKPGGRDAIRVAMRELERAGYLSMEKERVEGGRFETKILVYEHPSLNPFVKRKIRKLRSA